MRVVKVSALVAAMLLIAGDIGANMVVPAVSGHPLSYLVSIAMMAFAGVLVVVAYVAHVFGRLDAKMDLLLELVIGRMAELESFLEDRDGRLADGCALRRIPESAAVRPLATSVVGRQPARPGS